MIFEVFIKVRFVRYLVIERNDLKFEEMIEI